MVATEEGSDYIREGTTYYYMMTRISGDAMCAAKLIESREDALYLGEMIGQLHAVLSQIDADVETVDLFQTLSSWAIPQAKTVLPGMEATLDAFLKKFTALYPQLPRQVIHRDPNPNNIIRSESGWSFIDFELSQKSIRIYDPCYAATAILSERFSEDRQSWIATYHAILGGYDIVAKLTDVERAAAPYVTIANQLICIAWFSQQDRYAEIFRVNREMTLWLIEHFDNLKLQ